MATSKKKLAEHRPKSSNKTQFHALLTDEQVTKLLGLAKKWNLTATDVVRRLITEASGK